jgi:dihydrofolate reductase
MRELKGKPGTDRAIYRHGHLAQTLLKRGLLDEIRLSVFPLFVGSGKPLFREGEKHAPTIAATNLPTGVVVMRYQPIAVLRGD